ncbi:amino acid ABC transporter permease [Rhodococcus wratislaviensis]|uniref:Glutamate ABC transporter permease protein GluD n=1 Tax=Rhodococcus wratislaviensis NBRC 100605 TaxID=1219028 RepID=X0Q5E3_RHOWR|nr:ABC transporter permease subunit [Rhodococcus wratislaviensis]GAF46452.1 glutamate ABC transporter permease protein GluD [Rhodococcus wratislaviensis NBRC 100605]
MDDLQFDPPGPRGRRRARLAGAATLVVAGVLLAEIIQRLAENGHFAPYRWRFLTELPDLLTLLNGLLATLRAGLIAAAIAFVLALGLLISGRSPRRWPRASTTVVVHVLRGLPLLLLIYFLARVSDSLGLNIPALAILIAGIVGYHAALLSEILRGGVNAVAKGQTEAALSLGVSPRRTFWFVVFPQGFRTMIPALMNEMVVIIKHSALGYVIPYADLLRQGKLMTAAEPQSVLQIFLVVAIIYLGVNLTLGTLATRVERRFLSGRPLSVAAPPLQPLVAGGIR